MHGKTINVSSLIEALENKERNRANHESVKKAISRSSSSVIKTLNDDGAVSINHSRLKKKASSLESFSIDETAEVSIEFNDLQNNESNRSRKDRLISTLKDLTTIGAEAEKVMVKELKLLSSQLNDNSVSLLHKLLVNSVKHGDLIRASASVQCLSSASSIRLTAVLLAEMTLMMLLVVQQFVDFILAYEQMSRQINDDKVTLVSHCITNTIEHSENPEKCYLDNKQDNQTAFFREPKMMSTLGIVFVYISFNSLRIMMKVIPLIFKNLRDWKMFNKLVVIRRIDLLLIVVMFAAMLYSSSEQAWCINQTAHKCGSVPLDFASRFIYSFQHWPFIKLLSFFCITSLVLVNCKTIEADNSSFLETLDDLMSITTSEDSKVTNSHNNLIRLNMMLMSIISGLAMMSLWILWTFSCFLTTSQNIHFIMFAMEVMFLSRMDQQLVSNRILAIKSLIL